MENLSRRGFLAAATAAAAGNCLAAEEGAADGAPKTFRPIPPPERFAAILAD